MLNNPKYTIICVGIATLLIGLWGELFAAAPTIVKITYATLIYSSIVLFPYNTIKNNDFGILANGLFILLLVDTFLQVFMSAYNTDPDMYEHGNKWITLFLNEYTTVSLIPPFFAFLVAQKTNIALFVKIIAMFILCSLGLAAIQTNSIAFLPLFLIAFFPYVKIKYKVLFIIVIIISLLTGIKRVRMLLIVNMFSFAAIILAYLTKNKFLSIAFTVICLIIPFIVFVPILSLAKGELSFFQTIMQYLAENNYIEDTDDTRTFLYLEIAEDINNNNTWFFGKGAYCHYFSTYFSQNAGDDPSRLYVEVPFLYMLLRGGIIYIVLYYSLLLLAMFRGFFLGKNHFIRIATIVIIGWYVNSFIGDLNGCRFHHLGFFFLVGCCLSKSLLRCSDTEIQAIFDEQYTKLQALKTILLLKVLKLHSKGE